LILDSSAIIAVLFEEPGYERVLEALARAPSVGVGTATLAETGIVLRARLGADAGAILARFLQESGAVEIPFGERHWRMAVDAFARYGKGRHPAGLNLGDCLTYATAKLTGGPLLFVGNDFTQTDLEIA
jgi:ribonuclease VapC